MPRIRPKYQLSSPNSIDKTTASVGIIKNQRLDLLFPILIVSPTPSFCSGESASGFISSSSQVSRDHFDVQAEGSCPRYGRCSDWCAAGGAGARRSRAIRLSRVSPRTLPGAAHIRELQDSGIARISALPQSIPAEVQILRREPLRWWGLSLRWCHDRRLAIWPQGP